MANNIIPNVSSGDLVGSTPTFPTNAVVRGDFLYLRDVNGNQIPGRTVSDGDEITVLYISNEKNIVLVQYPTGSGYRQGYVTNATSIIKYKDNYSWVNGSTPEAVYDFDKTTQIGTLDPRERAVVLYKVGGMTYVAYDTGKGKLTKSGLVHYEGSSKSTGGGSFNGVAPGEIVPGGFTYDNNAEVVGDELYLRDENGNRIPGRSVSVGDKITVLDVGYTKQLALIQYPAGNVVRQGYVTNATNLIRYFNQSMWHNGSTSEEVLDENGQHFGSLNPYEAATPLYKKNGMIHVVYNTDKGPNTKSGYVKYEGSVATRVDIPSPSITNAQKIVYGTSGRGRELAAYKVGNGSNSLIYVCAIHGWEDHWAADGIELTRIGNGLIEHFQNASTNNWSLYIIPVANPDGLSEGFTNNGPGRCTIVGAVDCNRDFPIGFTPYGDSRHWTNKEPLSVPESRCLRDFVSKIKGNTSGLTYLIDMHGWEDKTIGDSHISRAFQNQFGFVNGNYDGVYQAGFLISWANSIGVQSALIELPQSCYSHNDTVNGRYLQKSINAVTNLIGSSEGNISGGSSSSDVTYIAAGEVINVQSFLNIRKGPGTNYGKIGQLHQGGKVSVVAKNGDWYKIKVGSDYGYVNKDFIKIVAWLDENIQEGSTSSDITYTEVGEVVNVQSFLNVRKGPGTNYESVGQLHQGNKVNIVSKSGDWYRISSPMFGYVHKNFISVVSNKNSENIKNPSIKTFNEKLAGLKNYKSRKMWNAKPFNGDPEVVELKDYNTIAIHHSGRTLYEKIDNFQKYFQEERKYADIGYHFVISGDGSIYEGRKINNKGAHIEQNNTGKIGIVLLGNFHDGEGFIGDIEDIGNYLKGEGHTNPTDAQIGSLKELIKVIESEFDIKQIGGHRDFALKGHESVCPGNVGYKVLKDNNIIKL
ncbi:TPA: SH3 domain-containing protein [Clostridium perfringens]|uniref:SH3 domain-containing protein n=1 Tax=Clostridium perfringens TaxID=1502 RepID=UPI001A1AB818|nr:SH3 domain-containing protein [Clostridium perfringens]HAT4189318.1 SH3 domain-containing protein [Clostridium perfringens]HAT4194402.1 SH3 domain-containing protein [Clostridium perfringens]HAT4196832.1 SH3 domain-containing protein [Clostridium perfringens]HAT4204688.1 SH3 domain-containing protein [Clostridium perfringens]